MPPAEAAFLLGDSMNLDLGHTRDILAVCRRFGCTKEQAAYILATARWETNHTMQPVKEAYWLSEKWRKNNLRYWPWIGRGFVQLTWERNYRHASEKIGVDLIEDPDKAMHPQIAARVLVFGMMEGWFTTKSLPQYVNGKKDYRNARRVVNGMDKADQIAALANEYELAIADEYEPQGDPDDKPEPAKPTGLSRAIGSILEALANLLERLFRGKA